jgi:hypothetical protein
MYLSGRMISGETFDGCVSAIADIGGAQTRVGPVTGMGIVPGLPVNEVKPQELATGFGNVVGQNAPAPLTGRSNTRYLMPIMNLRKWSFGMLKQLDQRSDSGN